ncbi:peptidase C39 family protein [Pseudomonas sp.]|uniref:peptidase C39 family protein n=1 Tax=Pseudomonas sp. TaxID=306 RepID=UPI0039182BB5
MIVGLARRRPPGHDKREPMSQHASPLRSSVGRRWLVAGALLIGLSGCAGTPAPLPNDLAQRVEIGSVPFFRGNAHHGGALALAAMLSQQGVSITPGLLDGPLRLPQELDRLDTSIPRVAHEYGMVVYPLDKRLDALLRQVAAGDPVLLRYQEGSSFWAEPRYAVMVGYDRYKQQVLLRAGMSRRLSMDFKAFEQAWAEQGRWAVLIQPPRRLPAQVDRARWLQAAEALARDGQEGAARQAVSRLQE